MYGVILYFCTLYFVILFVLHCVTALCCKIQQEHLESADQGESGVWTPDSDDFPNLTDTSLSRYTFE